MAMPGRRPVRCELPHPCGHPAPDYGDMAERWSVILVCMNRTGNWRGHPSPDDVLRTVFGGCLHPSAHTG
jgi:hypothetical protein